MSSISDNDETICPICMDNIINRNNIAITPCGHKFCFNCIITSLQTIYTCPCCRNVLLADTDSEIIEPSLTIKERIVLYLKRIYREGFTNKELLYIIISVLSYQNYNYCNNSIDNTINNFMKYNSISECYYLDYNYLDYNKSFFNDYFKYHLSYFLLFFIFI